jgi:predicted nucleotidyltransferase
MPQSHILAQIGHELDRTEVVAGVHILYACESGPRVWGLAPDESDYTVRFIYVHPATWYLTVDGKRRDVIERSAGRLDLAGWDLRKALRQMRKSDPVLYEWLASPSVYRQSNAMHFVCDLAPSYTDPARIWHYYLRMASSAFHAVQGSSVWLKKYLYVLRPLLALIWMERALGAVPARFTDLVACVDHPIIAETVRHLVSQLEGGADAVRVKRIAPLDAFLRAELDRLSGLSIAAAPRRDAAPLDHAFHMILGVL